MTYSEDQYNSARARARIDGIAELLQKFFGVTQAHLNEDGTIQCMFEAASCDGTGRERRLVLLSPENTPEQNVAVVLDARKRQAWYGAHREDIPGIDPPVMKSMQEEERSLTSH